MLGLALTLLSIPFLLPIISWVMTYRLRTRVAELEERLSEQRDQISTLTGQVTQLRKQVVDTRPAAESAQPQASRPAPAAPTPPAPPRPMAPVPPPAPPVPPVAAAPPAMKPVPPPQAPPRPAAAPAVPSVPALPPRRPAPPSEPPPPAWSFDWEQFVGVRLFSAIAGIALVVAAVFFLRYSLDNGWLQPPVRVVIGILAGIGLLVVCELKAARKYPATANALDAAAIAILFSTFFATHSLWNLISATLAFVLLALVTATAVALSIRRESLFIAVLGLLGGFATPALLSTGENRPIPLFAYLLLLNVGLAWVAYRRGWTILSVLTLVFTTLYQWGWAAKFLSAADIPLALAVFVLFPVVGFGMFAAARMRDRLDDDEHGTFELTALASSALPVLFAVYLASVPAFGERYALLFGYLFVLDAGLAAVALALRREQLLVAAGASSPLVFGVWLARSYTPGLALPIVGFVALFVVFFLALPAVASSLKRPLGTMGTSATYAAPVLLFAFPVLAALEPAAARPQLLFPALFALVGVLAWRGVASGTGAYYYVAAFFALAAEAVWSLRHLTSETLGAGLALFAGFAVLYIGVPMVARRVGRPLTPEGGGGMVLLASTILLLFLAAGPSTPSGLWGLAFLLAVLNAAMFVESAAGGLTALSIGASLVSWVVLFLWWTRSAATIGLLPSLLFLVGLTLVMVAGHAWMARRSETASETTHAATPGLNHGFWLPLIGHLFLVAVAINPEWSIPPWPLFGALGVVTLAMSVAALASRQVLFHALATVGTAVVLSAWRLRAQPDGWAEVSLAGFAVLAVYALASIRLARRSPKLTAVAAAVVLVLAELNTIASALAPGSPPVALTLTAHVLAFALLLALTWEFEWPVVAPATAALAALALGGAAAVRDRAWPALLLHAAVIYAPFALYPLIAGAKLATRDPYISALIVAAASLLAGRQGMIDGGYQWMVGVVPVIIGLVTTVHLRHLLRIEPAGTRDMGRLALVGGGALAFLTVAIPMQLEHQWITIGWAFEGAALAWLFTRVPHRGLLYASLTLLAAVFARLVLNPEVFLYEPRGAMRIVNWYLYTYVLAAAAMGAAAWWFSRSDDRIADQIPRPRHVLPAAAVVVLFFLVNIEIADFYATGPEIVFRFGVTIAQDLTYTIAWLVFGLALLAAGIVAHARPARFAAVSLITVTTFKCFLYDLSSLEGLYRVGAFLGLGISLALVSLVLQKFVLAPKESQS
ncbi:MAG TPA: DUF2339 domain-containing protein [Vicinamibacterales bacterium]|jgi:hypothetical protein|nr:DUF2339 domain-containing protein [Vicinamibacterales bacterium]